MTDCWRVYCVVPVDSTRLHQLVTGTHRVTGWRGGVQRGSNDEGRHTDVVVDDDDEEDEDNDDEDSTHTATSIIN